MAGGMRRGRDHGTLAERAARSRGSADGPPVPPVPPVPPAPQLRHCWVVGDHGPLPALLLGWDQRAAGWWGRVVHPVVSTDGGWVVVEEWLPAERLRATAPGA